MLIGLGAIAFVLAVMLSVQAIELLRERSEVNRRAIAARLDEFARTVALRTEYQLLTPMATALGRAAPGASSPGELQMRMTQQLRDCKCTPPSGLAMRSDGTTHPVVTTNQSRSNERDLAHWLADTVAKQARLPHLSAANLIGRPDWPGGAPTIDGRIVFGLLVSTVTPSPRLFGYMVRFAASDTIDCILATEVDPAAFLAQALADSTAQPGTKAMPVALRTPSVAVEIADAAGRPLHSDGRQRWDAGRRTLLLPPDVARLALAITPIAPVASPLDARVTLFDARGRLLTILVLFLITVSLGTVAMIQVRGEHALAMRRTRFVSSVSHELRTPLTQIRLFAELLQDQGIRTDRRTEYARIIDQEAQRLTYLIDNVLAFTTLDGSGGALPRVPISISEILSKTLERFAPLAASRDAAIEAAITPNVIVQGTEDALHRICLNVLDNAVKYGPPGQTVRVQLGISGNSVHITVDDAGPGIALGDRDRIFDPFVRLPNSTTTASGGSGIGLAIVRSLMAALGGAVAIEDAPGGGTRVRLSFVRAQNGPTLETRMEAIPVDHPVEVA